MQKLEISFEEVFSQLEAWGNESRRKFNAKHNAGENQFGVMMGNLRQFAKKIKVNHLLAMQLWQSQNIDAMMLATMIMDPKQLSKDDINQMIEGITFFLLLDELVYHVIVKTDYANELYTQWINSNQEYVGRAGWNILISKVMNGQIEDLKIDELLEWIESQIKEAPKLKQESMNRCLCEIGIHLPEFRAICIAIGERIGRLDDRPIPKGCTSSYAPEWIAAVLARKNK